MRSGYVSTSFLIITSNSVASSSFNLLGKGRQKAGIRIDGFVSMMCLDQECWRNKNTNNHKRWVSHEVPTCCNLWSKYSIQVPVCACSVWKTWMICTYAWHNILSMMRERGDYHCAFLFLLGVEGEVNGLLTTFINQNVGFVSSNFEWKKTKTAALWMCPDGFAPVSERFCAWLCATFRKNPTKQIPYSVDCYVSQDSSKHDQMERLR